MSSFRRSAVGQVLFALPPAIRVILVACTLIWLVQLTTAGILAGVWYELGLVPIMFVRGLRLWQLVTYQFLHSLNPLHLVLNMYGVWMFGRDLERRWGTGRFVRYYLACGVGAGLLHVAITLALVPEVADVPVIGASGALFGLMMAFAMIWPRREFYLFPFPIAVQVRWLVLAYGLFALLAAWNPASRVANLAHLGGLLTGWLYLRVGERLGAVGGLPRRAGDWVRGLQRSRRRAKMKVVDRDFDRWLEEQADDETKH